MGCLLCIRIVIYVVIRSFQWYRQYFILDCIITVSDFIRFYYLLAIQRQCKWSLAVIEILIHRIMTPKTNVKFCSYHIVIIFILKIHHHRDRNTNETWFMKFSVLCKKAAQRTYFSSTCEVSCKIYILDIHYDAIHYCPNPTEPYLIWTFVFQLRYLAVMGELCNIFCEYYSELWRNILAIESQRLPHGIVFPGPLNFRCMDTRNVPILANLGQKQVLSTFITTQLAICIHQYRYNSSYGIKNLI